MGSFGKGFVAIWHDIAEGRERAYEDWHTREHMPERLGVPGFLRGRRYMNWDQRPHVCFTLYEGAHVETFRSPGYLARLNDPTPWSVEAQPSLVNFLRGACETMLTIGDGAAGAAATVRVQMTAGGRDEAERDLKAACVRIADLHGVTAVHLGRHRPEVASAPTGETKLRPNPSKLTFDYVLIVEAIGLDHLERARDGMRAAIGQWWPGSDGVGVYRLEFLLLSPTV